MNLILYLSEAVIPILVLLIVEWPDAPAACI